MTSARRLQEDYRRILGITEDTRGLDDELPRMRIGGQRGIWQIGNSELKTGSSGKGGSDAAEEGEEETEDPVTPDEDSSNQNEDGSGGGGGLTNPPNSGDDFIINPDRPPVGVDVNDGTFGDNWSTGGVTRLQDCETEKCIELVEVGGYVPPDGWDGWDDPPTQTNDDGTFQSGQYYRIVVTPQVFRGATVTQVCKSRFESTSGFSDRFFTYQSHTITGDFSASSFTVVISGTQTMIGSGNVTSRTLTNTVQRTNCSQSDINNQVANCHLSEMPSFTPDFWPADNCIQLAPNAQGNWQASPRENPNDMTAKYSEAKSVLNLCNSAGESIEVYPRRGGGYVYFNADQGIWAASDASGRKRSFGSSSTLNQEIARG